MIFENRYQAGILLAEKLQSKKLSPKNSTIASIPRGGVVVGEAIAKTLSIPHVAMVIKKLGAPANPELAVGATASFGKSILDRWLIADLSIPKDYLKREILKKRKEAKSRERLLGTSATYEKYKNKIVVVVDDGLATGQTAKAAAKIIRAFGPKNLILAVPCAAPVTLESIKDDYDEIICLEVSQDLFAVGQFYRDFRPVTDSEVKLILTSSVVLDKRPIDV